MIGATEPAGPDPGSRPAVEVRRRVPSRIARSLATVSALLIVLPYAGPAVRADSSQVLLVSGGTVDVMEVTLPRTVATFGDGLTPDGPPGDTLLPLVAHHDLSPARAGTCFEWGAAITVSSNDGYRIDARPTTLNGSMGIMADPPSGFADCAGRGLLVGPPVPLVAPQPTGGSRTHAYCLTLMVLRDEPAPSTVAAVVLEVRPSS
jgi:hypothetical protein